MCSGGEYSPFILRFSKSMHRPNPKHVIGGKPRTAEGAVLNPYKVSENLESGFSFYRSFEYNRDLPVYNTFVLKPGSLSKSLRYHFIKTADLKTEGSLTPNTLIFSFEDARELNRFENVMKYSRNKAFKASVSHLEAISCITLITRSKSISGKPTNSAP